MKTTRQFWCNTCRTSEPMDAMELKEHLKSAHSLDGKITGKKQATSFLDGEGGWFQQNYQWKLPGGVRVTEVREGVTGQNYP